MKAAVQREDGLMHTVILGLLHCRKSLPAQLPSLGQHPATCLQLNDCRRDSSPGQPGLLQPSLTLTYRHGDKGRVFLMPSRASTLWISALLSGHEITIPPMASRDGLPSAWDVAPGEALPRAWWLQHGDSCIAEVTSSALLQEHTVCSWGNGAASLPCRRSKPL